MRNTFIKYKYPKLHCRNGELCTTAHCDRIPYGTYVLAAEAEINGRLGSCCGHDATPAAMSRYRQRIPVSSDSIGSLRSCRQPLRSGSHHIDDLCDGAKSVLVSMLFFRRPHWRDGVALLRDVVAFRWRIINVLDMLVVGISCTFALLDRKFSECRR